MTNKFTIGIVGGGAVGRAVAAYYPGVKVYDKYKPQDPVAEVAKADYIFVSVPTPYDKGADLREMDDAIATIAANLVNPTKQVVIIKSTVVPGTTDRYQEQYPEINFVFNPEFLTEATAVEDFAKPDKQIVGFTARTKPLAEKVLAILPPAVYQKVFPSTVAEMVKYGINTYYGFKVIFGNSVYDLCQALGIDYDAVHEGLVADHRVVDSHFDVFAGGYRGYDGKCLPKDIQTLTHFAARSLGVDVTFLERITKINQRLRKEKTI